MGPRRSPGAVAAAAVLLLGSPARAADGADGSELSLVLDEAVSWIDKAGQARLTRLALDLAVRDGTIAEDVLGTTVLWDARFAIRAAYNKAEFEGRLVAGDRPADRLRLRVEGKIPRDRWGFGGAEAAYDLDLRREGDALKGTFAGAFGGRPVKGRAEGRLAEPFSTPIAGFAPPAPREHPRLVFRKSEIPDLRRRAETREGRAMLERLRLLLAEPVQAYDAGYHAAGHGLLWILGGDRGEARRAQEIVELSLFGKGHPGGNPWQPGQERERHLRAPLGAGVALAYDLCYDAWPEGFRARVTAALEWKAKDLIEGAAQEEYNDNDPSNHVAICQGAGGVVAMALLGEPGEYVPEPAAPAAEIANALEAPADYTPGAGVPVVKLEMGRMPTRWLFAGPLKPEDADREFLADLGGKEKARPEAGTRISSGGKTIAFAPLDPAKGIWNSKYTEGFDALDLVTPIDRDYHSTLFYFTVVENERPRLVRFLCESRNVRAFLAGRRLVREGFLRLGAGRFPLLLQIAVGETQPWGRIWAMPRFVEGTVEEAEEATRRHARDLAEWARGREAWLVRGKDIPSIPRLLALAEHRMRRHVRLSSGDRGWYNEGDDYSRYAHTVGTLPFEVAWRNVRGQAFGGSRPGAGWYAPLYACRLIDRDDKPALPWYGPYGGRWTGDIYRSGDFVLAFGLVPSELVPAVRWVFDRLWGLEGDGTFGIHEPHQAIYALARYPFGIEPRTPEGILPRALIDRDKGYCQFRDRWHGGDDFIACIYGKSEPTGGGWSYADAASFRIFGLGTAWAQKGGSGKDGGRDVENAVVVPGTSGWLGARVTSFSERPDGGGIVCMETSDVYLARPDGKGGSAGDPVTEAPAGARIVAGRYLDWGIRGLRSFAVDYGRTSGAHALVAVADRLSLEAGGRLPAGEPVWQLHAGGALSAEGDSFRIEGEGGATLRGRFLAPAGVTLSVRDGRLEASGGRDFFVVMTVQRGAAPEVTVQGNGLDAKAAVGRQTVRFDGVTVLFGE